MNIHTRQVDPIDKITERWKANAEWRPAAAREKDKEWSAKMSYAPQPNNVVDGFRHSMKCPFLRTPPEPCDCHPLDESKAMRGEDVLRIFKPLPDDEAKALRHYLGDDHDRLSKIALLVQALTYGEMTELAAALWRAKPDEGELNKETLPGVLWRWSTS